MLLPFCFYARANLFLKHLHYYTSLLTWFSGLFHHRLDGRERLQAAPWCLSAMIPDPACSLGNVGTQGILGMLSWSQRPFLICSEVPAIFRDQHCKLPPEFLTRHRLPQWVSLCVPLVKTHSTPINLCIWLYRGRTQTGGVQVPKSTWWLEHSFGAALDLDHSMVRLPPASSSKP